MTRLNLYIAFVVSGAVLVATAAVAQGAQGGQDIDAALVAWGVLLFAVRGMGVRIRRGNDVEYVKCEAIAFVPMLGTLDPAAGILIVALVESVWSLIIRLPMRNKVFNASASVVSYGTAALALAMFGSALPPVSSGVVGVACGYAVGQLLMTGVMTFSSSGGFGSLLVAGIRNSLAAWAVCVAGGVLILVAIQLSPAYAIGVWVIFVIVHTSSRAALELRMFDHAVSDLDHRRTAVGDADSRIPALACNVMDSAMCLYDASGARIRIYENEGSSELHTAEIGIQHGSSTDVELKLDGVRVGELVVWRSFGQDLRTLPVRGRLRRLLDLYVRHVATAIDRELQIAAADRAVTASNLILGHTDDALVLVDDRYVIRAWNPAMEEISGRASADVVGTDALSVLPGIEQFVIQDAGQRETSSLLLASGDVLVVRIACAPIVLRAGSGWIVAVRDGNRELAAEKLKRDFIAAVSHELRTPLATVRGFVLTLLRDDIALGEAQRDEYLRLVESESARLERLISDLLDSSAIEAGGRLQMDIRRGALQDTVDRAVASFAVACPDVIVNVRQRLCTSIEVAHDPDRLIQVITNFLENARRHGESDAIDVSVASCEAGGVTISVRDYGRGIQPEIRDRIFERFWSAHPNTAGRTVGMGLGLYISRRLVEAMGASVMVASDIGSGSTFTVAFPSP